MDGQTKCPECGIENPASRATCQVCHAPLRKDAKGTATERNKIIIKGTPPEPEAKTDVAPEKEKGGVTGKAGHTPKTTSKNPFGDKKEPTTEEEPKINPFQSGIKTGSKTATEVAAKSRSIVKRRPRRRTKAPTDTQYFKLENGKLIPVEISLRIRDLKRKQVTTEARALISFWNRNKSLIDTN